MRRLIVTLMLFSLSAAAQAADDVAPPRIILMIGDGMGAAEISVARAYAKGIRGRLFMESLPHQATAVVTALREDDPRVGDYVGDSASGGTALATGRKTSVGRIATAAGSGAPLATILEIAQAKGLKTGIVTTASITDATPAAFASHVRIRFCQSPDRMAARFPGVADCQADRKDRGGAGSIIEQLVDHRITLVMGGGAEMLAGNVGDHAQALGITLLGNPGDLSDDRLADRTYALLTTGDFPLEWQGERDTAAMPLAAYQDGELAFPAAETCIASDQFKKSGLPDLAQMTGQALATVGQGGEGFFLMIEGALIDKASHDANPCGMIGALLAFDRAVEVARRYAGANPGTLLIVTADHGQATQAIFSPALYRTFVRDLGPEHFPGRIALLKTTEGGELLVNYGTPHLGGQSHTGVSVPVFAYGEGAEQISGVMEQTDLFAIMQKRLR